MLVLSRNVGESIILVHPEIGRMEVCVVGFKTGRGGERVGVRIGVNAPPDVSIHREEIQDLIDSGRGVSK